jgi:lipoprotein-releasing system permease protein
VNTSFFIAKRYLFSKKSQNVINLISSISVVGITISTAAMVIVLSAFNGIEGLVLTLFNSFESDIKIEAAHSKTFNKNFINQGIFEDPDIINYSEIIEETVIIKNQEQFTFGTIKGVQNSFLDIVKMEDYLIDGKSILKDSQGPFGLVGIGALQNLNGYIYESDNQYDYFTVFSPNRNEKIKRNSTSGFQMSKIPIAGTFSFNNTIDASYLIVPIDYAAKVLGYDKDITAIEIDFKDDVDLQEKKQEIQSIIGDSFTLKTAYEQNELMFKTSQSERLMTTILLGFIFFLGTLNMIATMAMLIIEKKNNLNTLISMGAETHQLQNVFFYVGLLINGLGLVIGLVIGYLISFAQIKLGLLKMDGGMIDYFPMEILWSDLIMILFITTIIGTFAAYIPSKLLIRKLV